MGTSTAIMDLTVACVTSVKNATGVELDLTQDTLPILDHYAALADSPRDEVVSLVAPMSGAYFGELIRRQLEDGEWLSDSDDYAQWRLRFERCSLTFNPIGIALEVLLGEDIPDWGAHLQTAPEDQLRVKKALEVYGTGYSAKVQGKQLLLNIGYMGRGLNRPAQYVIDIPAGITVECPNPTQIMVSGCDKQLVGEFAARTRRARPPEPYKGKGVRYYGEHIIQKAGKSFVGGEK